ncbi:MAG: hypothetical protein JNJ44_08760 [Zoogloeaceae bacterium]|nr:hypothetical protein [Zoogloeaceae bacterium]
MSRIHFAFETRLAAVDSEIAKLKYVCNLQGDDVAVFAQLNDSLSHPAAVGHDRACQNLRGLLFLKTFIRYDQLKAAGALPAGQAPVERWY